MGDSALDKVLETVLVTVGHNWSQLVTDRALCIMQPLVTRSLGCLGPVP